MVSLRRPTRCRRAAVSASISWRRSCCHRWRCLRPPPSSDRARSAGWLRARSRASAVALGRGDAGDAAGRDSVARRRGRPVAVGDERRPPQERVHRQHEPRDPDAAQLGARAVAAAARRRRGAADRRSAQVPGDHHAQRADPAAPDRRHPRPVAHRSRAPRDRHRRTSTSRRRCGDRRSVVSAGDGEGSGRHASSCPTRCRWCAATSIASARS